MNDSIKSLRSWAGDPAANAGWRAGTRGLAFRIGSAGGYFKRAAGRLSDNGAGMRESATRAAGLVADLADAPRLSFTFHR